MIMYEISNRHRDEAIEMLSIFANPEKGSDMSEMALYNLRRRALLLVKKLEKKQPIQK